MYVRVLLLLRLVLLLLLLLLLPYATYYAMPRQVRTHARACTHARTHTHMNARTHARRHARTHARTRDCYLKINRILNQNTLEHGQKKHQNSSKIAPQIDLFGRPFGLHFWYFFGNAPRDPLKSVLEAFWEIVKTPKTPLGQKRRFF